MSRGAHSSRIHAENLVVEATEVPLVLLDELRLKAAVSVSGNLDLDVALVGTQPLAAPAVPTIALFFRWRLTLVVTQVLIELGVHGSVDQRRRQLLQQPIRSSQVFRLAVVLQQLVQELRGNGPLARLIFLGRFLGHR